jgi:cation:H+ antiporter
MIPFIFLILGFLLLIKGADIFVDGSSNVAKIFKVPTVIIGLTIVAFGTSSPELAVNISAALKGSGSITLGNIVGSNIVNILFILSVTCLIKPLNIKESILKKEFPFLVFITLVLLLMCMDNGVDQISRLDGMLLLGLFIMFFINLIKTSLNNRPLASKYEENNSQENKKFFLLKNIIMTAIGFIMIVYGGDLVVKNSIIIAQILGVSERIIGLTVVALGTSLPELVTTVVATFKNENDIALGNIIGSNIFNILMILGVSSTISPITINKYNGFDIIILFLATVGTYIFFYGKKTVSKHEGIVLSIGYLLYMGYLLF